VAKVGNQYNTIWADYCGNPAEAFTSSTSGKLRFRYPHILTFKNIVKEATEPMLYYMTFSCNGRIKGGAEKMQHALSPTAKTIAHAITHKVSQTLTAFGLQDKATRIMNVYYHGSGKSFMITLGYAINFKPKFSAVKENWVKVKTTAKASRVTDKIDYAGLKKEAMKALCDLGWDNSKIAHALNTQVGKVVGVTAWHTHRDSWKKVA
jgi:hypothetical protein